MTELEGWMLRKIVLTAAVAAMAGGGAAAQERGPAPSDLEILQAYADDFERDPFFTGPLRFGVKIEEDFYLIEGTPASESAEAEVTVRASGPDASTFYFIIESSEVLKKLYGEKINALTLAGKANSTDYAPLDLSFPEGAGLPAWLEGKLTPFLFHFWTRGWPEVVPFAAQETRVVHSGNIGVFYYQPGLRSGWLDIRPGQHVNEGEVTPDPFPSMVILVEGTLRSFIGEEEIVLRAGEMLFIPPGVEHEFINEGEANARGFLFMFGEGA